MQGMTGTTFSTASGSAAVTPRIRWITLAARILLGLVFLGSGAMGLLRPPPLTSPPIPEGLLPLTTGMFRSHLFTLLKVTELAVGLLLLTNRFVPLALVVLAPITLNIVLVHLLFAPSGLPVALLVLALHLYLAWSYRSAYRGLLQARGTPG